MFPQSVKTRHRAMYDFEGCYEQLCSLQGSVPLQIVKAHIKDGVIDINGDKIRMLDWAPVLDSIKVNKNLRYMAIKSFFQFSASNSSKKTHYFKRKTPAICSKDVTQWLATSLRSCLMISPALRCLDLQGVPLRERDVSILCNGIEKNGSLSFLSFNYCQIGDKGVQIFCRAVRSHPSLSHVSLSGCNITKNGAAAIAKLIKHQSVLRHGEAWVDSLRYRTPNLNCMGGIRRISLNCNPMIGDDGIEAFNDALRDDLWVKALDFQLCGLSTKGALSLLETMHYNHTVVVLDLRQNPMIDSTTLRTLLGRVLMNASGSDEVDYPWVKAEAPKDPYNTRKYRPPKASNRNFARKCVAKQLKSSSFENLSTKSRSKTPAKYKSSLAWQTTVKSCDFSSIADESKANLTILPHSDHLSSSGDIQSRFEADPINDTSLLDDSHLTLNQSLAFIKQLKIELINSQRKLKAALSSEKSLNAKILTLEVENARLKKDLAASFEQSKYRSQLEDETFLDSIEQSFNKFHDFLNKLHSVGLGSLAKEAGFSKDFMFPHSKSLPTNDLKYAREVKTTSAKSTKNKTFDQNKQKVGCSLSAKNVKKFVETGQKSLSRKEEKPLTDTKDERLVLQEKRLAKLREEEKVVKLREEKLAKMKEDEELAKLKLEEELTKLKEEEKLAKLKEEEEELTKKKSKLNKEDEKQVHTKTDEEITEKTRSDPIFVFQEDNMIKVNYSDDSFVSSHESVKLDSSSRDSFQQSNSGRSKSRRSSSTQNKPRRSTSSHISSSQRISNPNLSDSTIENKEGSSSIQEDFSDASANTSKDSF